VSLSTGQDLHHLFFLFSDAAVPTWWTQEPLETPVLTGWLAGPSALQYTGTEEHMIEDALQSLALIFKIDKAKLKQELLAARVFNWTDDPYALGAYSYSTLHAQQFMKQLMKPVEHKLFFAGEALDRGHGTGNVEAALGSGMEVVKEMIG